MYRRKRIAAVVPAAGKGSRMKQQINKQFIMLGDRPLLAHTLGVLQECSAVDEIVVVVAKEEIDYCHRNIINRYALSKAHRVVAGGDTRKQSVANGLNAIDTNTDMVVVHDGARPFFTCDMIEKGISIILDGNGDGAACAVPLKDTIKVVNRTNGVVKTLKRSSLMAVQTPQCFRHHILTEAFRMAEREDIEATDDLMLLERYGYRVVLYPGSNRNIKITTPEDMIIAKAFLNGDITR